MKRYSFLCVFVVTFSISSLSACSMQSKNQLKYLWKENQQLILVLTSDWNANRGVMLRFQYQHYHWVSVGHSFIVSIGKNGSAWGIGMSPLVSHGLVKTERDLRSPAGIFQIGYSFGYAQKINTTYPYRALNKDDYCIDNSQSIYYNQIVNHQQVSFDIARDSTEPMRRDIHLNGDQSYKLGFILNYNSQNISGKGSCIFVHLRTDKDITTAGCTAMDEQNMIEILKWLDKKNDPVFVLLPIEIYKQKRKIWELPIVKNLSK